MTNPGPCQCWIQTHPTGHANHPPCARCGRTDTIKATQYRKFDGWLTAEWFCHANPDGTKAEPDCYHLATTGSGS